MVELIILDGRNFNVKDYMFTQDYVILFDSIVQNASTFNISKVNLNAASNDIIVTRGLDKQYIGVIDGITVERNIVKVTAYHFSSKLDMSYLGESKTDVNLGDYIKQVVEENLINSNDELQNISYLQVENKATIVGAVSLKANAAANILTTISSILKGYEIVIDYLLVYDLSGQIRAIKMEIKDVSKEIILKEKETFISKVNIVDGKIGAVNKITFYPNANNILYKDTLNYYLLTDGQISNDAKDVKRVIPVVSEIQYYQDADVYYDEINKNPGATLMAKVKEKFAHTAFNHFISLVVNKNNAVNPSGLNLGDRVIFIDKNNKQYRSIVTKLRYTSSGESVEVELGLNRISLTDKLAMKKEVN